MTKVTKVTELRGALCVGLHRAWSVESGWFSTVSLLAEGGYTTFRVTEMVDRIWLLLLMPSVGSILDITHPSGLDTS